MFLVVSKLVSFLAGRIHYQLDIDLFLVRSTELQNEAGDI